jgi:hypothetical protein
MIETLQRNVMEAEEESSENLDPRVLSSVLISLKLSQTKEEVGVVEDPHSRLLELMHSAPVKALLDTAALHARRQGIPAHEALQQIVSHMQEIDKLWNLVLMKEGLSRLSSQYH